MPDVCLRAKVQEPGRELRLSKLDYAVAGALSLAQVALHCGDRVGLLAYGRRIQQNVNAARGVRQVRAILESLARVRGEVLEADHGRAAHALMTTQKRRSLVVWLTDFAETATMPDVIEYAMHLTSRHSGSFCRHGPARFERARLQPLRNRKTRCIATPPRSKSRNAATCSCAAFVSAES